LQSQVPESRRSWDNDVGFYDDRVVVGWVRAAGSEDAFMKIAGCDFHPRWQQIAVFDPQTDDVSEHQLVIETEKWSGLIARWRLQRWPRS
jgi:hypothetical protein